MVSLPKGSPVVTGLPASKETVPQFLSRLAASSFTGYAQYAFARSTTVLLFEAGRLIALVASRGEQRVSGLEGLTELSQWVASEDGIIDVYRLSGELTRSLSGLLHGDTLLRGQEIKLMDVRSLTAKLKAQRFNGCIRVYTPTRTTLVFYRDGAGFGFFHDGSEVMENTAAESQKIANLPGAKMDVLVSRPVEQLQSYDLLEVVNLDKIWGAAVRVHEGDAEEAQRLRSAARLSALEESLKTIAAEVLGGLGKSLVAKELAGRGGPHCLLEPAAVEGVLSGVERSAKLVAGPSKTRDLIERLRVEVHRQLPPSTTP